MVRSWSQVASYQPWEVCLRCPEGWIRNDSGWPGLTKQQQQQNLNRALFV